MIEMKRRLRLSIEVTPPTWCRELVPLDFDLSGCSLTSILEYVRRTKATCPSEADLQWLAGMGPDNAKSYTVVYDRASQIDATTMLIVAIWPNADIELKQGSRNFIKITRKEWDDINAAVALRYFTWEQQQQQYNTDAIKMEVAQ